MDLSKSISSGLAVSSTHLAAIAPPTVEKKEHAVSMDPSVYQQKKDVRNLKSVWKKGCVDLMGNNALPQMKGAPNPSFAPKRGSAHIYPDPKTTNRLMVHVSAAVLDVKNLPFAEPAAFVDFLMDCA